MSAGFKPILRIFAFFGVYLSVFIILKPIFMAVYHPLMGDITTVDWFNVIVHGLAMDCSMSGYLTVVPAILSIAAVWTSVKALTVINKIYIAITATLISIVAITDLALYGYWNFRLDTTPFFYFFSSPASALASVSVMEAISGFVGAAVCAFLLYIYIYKTAGAVTIKPMRKIVPTIVTIIFTAALIIPIRGSFTVSTMNLSRSYFSSNQRLNHAAINPLFSLMYSATHQSDFAS